MKTLDHNIHFSWEKKSTQKIDEKQTESIFKHVIVSLLIRSCDTNSVDTTPHAFAWVFLPHSLHLEKNIFRLAITALQFKKFFFIDLHLQEDKWYIFSSFLEVRILFLVLRLGNAMFWCVIRNGSHKHSIGVVSISLESRVWTWWGVDAY